MSTPQEEHREKPPALPRVVLRAAISISYDSVAGFLLPTSKTVVSDRCMWTRGKPICGVASGPAG